VKTRERVFKLIVFITAFSSASVAYAEQKSVSDVSKLPRSSARSLSVAHQSTGLKQKDLSKQNQVEKQTDSLAFLNQSPVATAILPVQSQLTVLSTLVEGFPLSTVKQIQLSLFRDINLKPALPLFVWLFLSALLLGLHVKKSKSQIFPA
jgi:hypothetical protein